MSLNSKQMMDLFGRGNFKTAQSLGCAIVTVDCFFIEDYNESKQQEMQKVIKTAQLVEEGG